MEPVSLTAGAIATVIFSKAIEKGGEQLGEAIADKIGQLLNLIRNKFQQEGVEGRLTKAEAEPNEKNKSRFEQELANQMEDDPEFAQKLKALKDELESDDRVKQILFKDVNVKGDAEIGDIEQTTTRGGSVTQEAVTGVKVGKNLKIGNMKQQN